MRTDDAALRLESVTLTYPGPQEITALRSVDLTVRQGEFLGILGPSGAGKSSLLQILGLLTTPTAGRVILDDSDVSAVSEEQRTALRCHRLGFVFQAFHLIEDRSPVENVALPLRYQGIASGEARERAVRSLHDVGLAHRMSGSCRTLSGGERQRVAIARALVTDPDVLLCDEPTGNLDSKNSASVMELLTTLQHSGRTVVVITHDPEVAAYAERRVELYDGRLIRDSDPREPTVPDTRAASKPATSTDARTPSRPRIRPIALLDEALAGLVERRVRSALTAVGVLLGVAMLVSILGLSATSTGQISQRFDRLLATTVSTSVRVPQGLVPERIARAAQLNGVTGVGVTWSILKAHLTPPAWEDVGVAATALEVQAATPQTWSVIKPTMRWGRTFDTGHLHQQVAVLGIGAARQLGINGPLGTQSILINHKPYLVLGVFDDVLRRPDLLMSVVVPAGLARQQWGPPPTGPDLSEVLVEVAPGAGPQVADELPYALLPGIPDAVVPTPPPNPRALRDDVSADMSDLFLMMALVTLFVGMVGISNTSLVAVMERFSEIGLRRAVGAHRSDIRRQFLLESAIIGTIGGLLGTLLGLMIVVAVSLYQVWTPVIDQRIVLAAPVLGIIAGALAGYFPARRAAKIDPAEAIRQ